jgi:hypothetical protein
MYANSFCPINDEFCALCYGLLAKYNSDNHIKKNEIGGACSTMGDRRGAYRVLLRGRNGKKLLERPRRRWEENFKIDFQEVG